jgi:serine protease Do
MIGSLETRTQQLGAAVILLVVCLFMPGEGDAQSTQSPPGVLDQFSNALRSLSDRVSAAVVEVHVSGYGKDDDNDPDASLVVKQYRIGSGVILDSDGYIVTNAHVVKGAKRVRVFLRSAAAAREAPPGRTAASKSGSVFEAAVIGTDEQIDLAVLKIQATGLPIIPFGSYEDLRQGQMVIAVGSPLGAHSAVTFGIISSVARQLESEDSAVYIQTDAALNPGNSGGALVDTSGRLVGINTLIMDGERQGFAIPCDIVKFSYEQIRRHGQVSQADVGFEVQEVTPTIASGLKLSRDSGVMVADVHPASPAERAGIRPEDIILAVDGRVTDSVVEFLNRVHQKQPGQQVVIQILRGSVVVAATIPLLEKKPQLDLHARTIEPERNLVAGLGVFVLELDGTTAESIPGIRQRSGVVVTSKSAAEEGAEGRNKLEIGDIIHALNGLNINTVADLRAATKNLKPEDAVVLRVERKGKLLYLALENE